MKTKTILLSCTIVMLLGMQVAQAEILIFNTSDNPFTPGVKNQGWWSATASNYDENENYAIGIDPLGRNPRNFFTFDLSLLSAPVLSATLELTRAEYASSAESEIFGLFDVLTDVATLNNNVGPSAEIYNDLGTGTSYGEFEVFSSGDKEDILHLALNAAAISDINNARGGWFSIGGSLLSPGSPVSDGTEGLFGRSGDSRVQQLVLEVIPEPGTIGFLSCGVVLLLRRHRTQNNRN